MSVFSYQHCIVKCATHHYHSPKAPKLPLRAFQHSFSTKSPQPKNPMKSRLSDVLEWVCFKPHYIRNVV